MSTNYSPTIVTDGAVFVGDALMPSTATSATKLYDRVGGNNGTMYNGSCLDFDGTDDYVEIATTYEPGNGNWALSMWINADAWSSYTLMGNTSGGPSASRYYISTAGKISFSNYDGAWQHANGNTVLSLSTWYFCTWVNYAGSSSTNGTMKMFVNGVADSSAVNSYTTNGGRLNAIGQNTASYFDGKIADVRFYNVALSDANVKELYNDSKVIIPSNVSQTNLTRWWTFAEGAGTICYDALGYTKYATMTNMTSADWLTGQTGAPQLVEGYNRPMLFDSTNDYVNCGASNALVTGTTLSISAWVRTVDTDKGRLFQGQKGAGSTSYSLIVNDNGGVATAGYVSCLTYTGAAHTYVSYDASIDDGAWHHLAMTTTASAQKLYADGALVASGTNTFSNTVSTDIAVIGSLGGTTEFVGGVINEVVLYDSELTLAQVQALAATGPNGGPLPPDAMSLSNSSDVVAYWRNDGNVTWTDRAGSANGTAVGSPDALLFKQGYNGQKNVNTGRDGQGFPLKFKNVGAIGFNGSSDYIQPDQSLSGPLVSTTGALDFWINFTDLDGYRGLYYLYDNAYSDYFILRGSGGSSLTLLAELSNSSIINHTTDLSTYLGQWINLVYTQDGTTIRVYVNGVEIDSVASTVWTGHLSTTPVCKIGYSVWASNYLNAALASVRVYNRALSYAEIQQNYNAQKSRFT